MTRASALSRAPNAANHPPEQCVAVSTLEVLSAHLVTVAHAPDRLSSLAASTMGSSSALSRELYIATVFFLSLHAIQHLSTVSAQTVTPLVNNTPAIGFCAGENYVYYSFNLTGDGSLIVNLTATAGDPDLYMALAAVVPYPTFFHNTWASMNFGSDEITLLSAQPGLYSIGVQAADTLSANWSITATTNSTVTQLFPSKNEASADMLCSHHAITAVFLFLLTAFLTWL
jgi:hypothetical protein